MPFNNRETIYTALFNQVVATGSFKKTGRIVKHWNDLKSGEFPALFMGERKEIASNQHRGVQKWTLQVDFFLYIDVGSDPNAVPAAVMNVLLDNLESVLKPTPDGKWQNLGMPGMVEAVRITDIVKDNGALQQKSVAIVSVDVITHS